jgi:hypothetical protein
MVCFCPFERSPDRLRVGNYEERLGLTNNLDPLTINVNWRDIAPKMGLNNQYVGDKYMLCSDLPTRSFLRNGKTGHANVK